MVKPNVTPVRQNVTPEGGPGHARGHGPHVSTVQATRLASRLPLRGRKAYTKIVTSDHDPNAEIPF